MTAILLVFAGFWAGAQNALAGGGPLVTIAALLLTGMDARTANLTSTVALFPGQIAAGWRARRSMDTIAIPIRATIAVNLIGGAAGAGLLLLTPAAAFLTAVPWLVLFATAIYAASGFVRPADAATRPMPASAFLALQAALSVYGGYFGGGNSFMMLALLATAGLSARIAGGAKNLLIALINAAAVAVFLFSGAVDFAAALPLAIGGIAGSIAGAWALDRIDERWLRLLVVLFGVALSAWLFVRG